MTPLDKWFAAEVLPHEAALTRYLRRAWPNADDIAELTQEALLRVYQAARIARPPAPRRTLFITARNLLIDKVRHERVVSIDFTQDMEALDVLIDEITPERRMNGRQELSRLADALDGLSDDCRAVLWMRRVEGLSQREVAKRLKMNEGTLESHMCRGMKALLRALTGAADDGGAEGKDGSLMTRSRS